MQTLNEDSRTEAATVSSGSVYGGDGGKERKTLSKREVNLGIRWEPSQRSEAKRGEAKRANDGIHFCTQI